jgi:sialate O-acetylesterase
MNRNDLLDQVLLGIGLACLLPLSASAEVKLPNLISDHAVLQRGVPIPVWGWAQPGEKVTVSLHGKTKSTQADASGHWQVQLDAESAGGPYEMTVAGTNSLTVKDLLIGDVWLASGQSNMAYGMKGNGVPPKGSTMPHTPELIAAATVPMLRLLKQPEHTATRPEDDTLGKWTLCLPSTVPEFSAIGYFFGRDLSKVENVPIGIIDSAFSGSPAIAWVSAQTLASDPVMQPLVAHWPSVAETHHEAPGPFANRSVAPGVTRFQGGSMWNLSVIYNGMIAPLLHTPIKGAMWYQGESDSGPEQAPFYPQLLETMIRDWRTNWHEDFPFFIVQISSFKANGPKAMWGFIRDSERVAAQAVDKTALVVTLDIGDPDDIHPPDKPDVALRLVAAARGLAYGEKGVSSGPLFQSAKPQGAAMLVTFDHAAGLNAKGGNPKSFELAGADGVFSPASATLQGTDALVTSPQVPQPLYVRYGWSNATDANLYNAAGLPASTFTTGPPPPLPK